MNRIAIAMEVKLGLATLWHTSPITAVTTFKDQRGRSFWPGRMHGSPAHAGIVQPQNVEEPRTWEAMVPPHTRG